MAYRSKISGRQLWRKRERVVGGDNAGGQSNKLHLHESTLFRRQLWWVQFGCVWHAYIKRRKHGMSILIRVFWAVVSAAHRPFVGDSVFTLDVEEKTQSVRIPKDYALAQNYPNPFNPTTMIQYDLPSASAVRLEIFDMLGRKVATLVNTTQRTGAHCLYASCVRLRAFIGHLLFIAGKQGSMSRRKKWCWWSEKSLPIFQYKWRKTTWEKSLWTKTAISVELQTT